MLVFGFGYGGGSPFFWGWDPTYFLVLIGVVLSLMASARVRSTFAKYSKVRNRSGYTGAMAAERILHSAGINDVRIEKVGGNLSDHYDPKAKILRLSESVYGESTVAAVGVAAHECGHAIQHQKGYAPLQLRSTLVPIASFGAGVSWWMVIAGIFFQGFNFLITLGIILFGAAVLFQIVTLPVEFNASSRAVRVLGETGILYDEEVGQARKVLGAAALTYVAAAATSILQLLRLLALANRRR